MADSQIVFPIEEIPSDHAVFMRAHKIHFRNGELEPSVFKAQGGTGMSVDWDKYSTATETKQRAKKPIDNAVLSLAVRGIREIPPLDVEHKPEANNRAHSEVNLPGKPEDLAEIRMLLKRKVVIIIPLDA